MGRRHGKCRPICWCTWLATWAYSLLCMGPDRKRRPCVSTASCDGSGIVQCSCCVILCIVGRKFFNGESVTSHFEGSIWYLREEVGRSRVFS